MNCGALAEPAGVDEDRGLGVSGFGRWAVGAVCRRARTPDGIGTVRWPRAVRRKTPTVRRASSSGRSRISTTSVRPGSIWPTRSSTPPSSPPTAGTPGMSDEELLAKLLALNLERAVQ